LKDKCPEKLVRLGNQPENFRPIFFAQRRNKLQFEENKGKSFKFSHKSKVKSYFRYILIQIDEATTAQTMVVVVEVHFILLLLPV
jgi:hypothetical protein